MSVSMFLMVALIGVLLVVVADDVLPAVETSAGRRYRRDLA